MTSLPLPVLLDVDREGDRFTLLVTRAAEPEHPRDITVHAVRGTGHLFRLPTSILRPEEVTMAVERLARVALERGLKGAPA